MTLISIIGLIGRAVGRVLTSSLGWAASLLYGRVPKAHQKYVEAMFGGAVLWGLLVLVTLVPPVLAFVLSTTPFVASTKLALLRTAIIAGLLLLPLVVGLCSTRVPPDGARPHGLAILGHSVRGYPLSILLAGMLVMLPLAGAARRIGSLRRGWADLSIAIVVKAGGYGPLVDDVERIVHRLGIETQRHRAPVVFELPGRVLALIAGRDVSDVLPEHVIELRGDRLEIGVYPSAIVVSGPPTERLAARAAIVTGLARAAAHTTISAESQKVEDRLEVAARPSTPRLDALAEVEAVDRELARLDVPAADWEILLRLRLQVERDVLRRA